MLQTLSSICSLAEEVKDDVTAFGTSGRDRVRIVCKAIYPSIWHQASHPNLEVSGFTFDFINFQNTKWKFKKQKQKNIFWQVAGAHLIGFHSLAGWGAVFFSKKKKTRPLPFLPPMKATLFFGFRIQQLTGEAMDFSTHDMMDDLNHPHFCEGQ